MNDLGPTGSSLHVGTSSCEQQARPAHRSLIPKGSCRSLPGRPEPRGNLNDPRSSIIANPGQPLGGGNGFHSFDQGLRRLLDIGHDGKVCSRGTTDMTRVHTAMNDLGPTGSSLHVGTQIEKEINLAGKASAASQIEGMIGGKVSSPAASLGGRNRQQLGQLHYIGTGSRGPDLVG